MKLKELLEKRGITRAQLANTTGIQKAAITNYAANKTEPRLSNVLKILKALDCSLDDLMGTPQPAKTFREALITKLDKSKCEDCPKLNTKDLKKVYRKKEVIREIENHLDKQFNLLDLFTEIGFFPADVKNIYEDLIATMKGTLAAPKRLDQETLDRAVKWIMESGDKELRQMVGV